MITQPWVNFAALSKDYNVEEPEIEKIDVNFNLPIVVTLSDGKVLTGKFKGGWGDEGKNGIFIDDYAISYDDIDTIRNVEK